MSLSFAAAKMNIEKHFEYLCRLCAANTKSKDSSSMPECVNILRTPQLKDKIQKYLQLMVTEMDVLPKVLCKSCFRHIEGIYALEKIATHTQKVFKDFIRQKKNKTEESNFEPVNSNPVTGQSVIRQAITAKPSRPPEDFNFSTAGTDANYHRTLNSGKTPTTSFDSRFYPTLMGQTASNLIPATSTPIRGAFGLTEKLQQNLKTFTSGGYVIGNFSPITGSPIYSESNRLSSSNSTASQVLQQKRKNLKMVLNNANAGGASSNAVARQTILPPPLFPLDQEHNKELNRRSVIKTTRTTKEEATATQNRFRLQQGISNSTLLGHVIKDVDLLKLILKALKWPWNKNSLDFQLARLKNTKFDDIMTDPNLLQDTDLTQILGPLISPSFVIQPPAAQVPIPQPQTIVHNFLSPPLPTEPAHSNVPISSSMTPPTLAAAIPYKLPAETSLQLITVPHDDYNISTSKLKPLQPLKQSQIKQQHKPHMAPYPGRNDSIDNEATALRFHRAPKKKLKQRYIAKAIKDTPVIVLSDDTDDDFVDNMDISLDPAIYPDVGENSNSNEAMLAKLNRQRAAMNKIGDSRRPSSKQSDIITVSASDFDNSFDDDVIFIDEAQNKNLLFSDKAISNSPVATCRITKRRKTLIQTSANTGVVVDLPFIKPQSKSMSSNSRHAIIDKVIPSNVMLDPRMQQSLPIAPVKTYANRKFNSDPQSNKTKSTVKNVAATAVMKPPKKIINKTPRELKSKTLADADSTTRSVVKEVLTEAKKSFTPSSDVDLEEQIDKITLTVEKEHKENELSENVQQLSTKSLNDCDAITIESEAQEDSHLDPATGVLSTSTAREPTNILADQSVDLTNNSFETNAEDNNSFIETISVMPSSVAFKSSIRPMRTRKCESPIKIEEKKKKTSVSIAADITVSTRPARVSKTLSKYYKAPAPPDIIKRDVLIKRKRGRPPINR